MSQTILPENYPSECGSEVIEKVIGGLQKEVKRTAYLDNETASISVMQDSSLIQLGQTELASRFIKKYSLLALGVSILSLLIACMALFLRK